MKQKSNVNMQSTVVTVNYRKNSYLKEHGVSFHWWRESETSMHRHDFYEFFIMTDGATRHELNGDTAILKKGALVMLTPEDAHQFRRIGERSSIHMNFCVSPDKFYGICAAIGADVEALCAPGARRSVELTAEELGYFTTKAGLINMLMRRGEKGYVALISAMIAQMISVISVAGGDELKGYPEWFKALLERIHSPENVACTARDVYAMGSFSPPVMVEYFKRYTGKTVAGYLKEMKCDYAREWLAETEMSTLEIAGLLGYDSLSHFNRIFKEYASIPPAKFRRAIKEGRAKAANADINERSVFDRQEEGAGSAANK